MTTFGNTTFDPNGTTTATPTDSDGLTETEKILIGVLVPVRKDFIALFAYNNYDKFCIENSKCSLTLWNYIWRSGWDKKLEKA